RGSTRLGDRGPRPLRHPPAPQGASLRPEGGPPPSSPGNGFGNEIPATRRTGGHQPDAASRPDLRKYECGIPGGRRSLKPGGLGEGGLVEDLDLPVAQLYQPLSLEALEDPVDAGPAGADEFGEAGLAEVHDA